MHTIIYVHFYTYVRNALGNTWRDSRIWPPLKDYMYTYTYIRTEPLYVHACTHKHLYTRHLAMKGKNQCLGLAKRAILILALCLQPAPTPFLEPADQPRRCLQPHTCPHPHLAAARQTCAMKGARKYIHPYHTHLHSISIHIIHSHVAPLPRRCCTKSKGKGSIYIHITHISTGYIHYTYL